MTTTNFSLNTLYLVYRHWFIRARQNLCRNFRAEVLTQSGSPLGGFYDGDERFAGQSVGPGAWFDCAEKLLWDRPPADRHHLFCFDDPHVWFDHRSEEHGALYGRAVRRAGVELDKLNHGMSLLAFFLCPSQRATMKTPVAWLYWTLVKTLLDPIGRDGRAAMGIEGSATPRQERQ